MNKFFHALLKRSERCLSCCLPVRDDWYLITGCPRSGTSALLRWLEDSPHVATFFEDRIPVLLGEALMTIHRFKKLGQRSSFLEKELRAIAWKNARTQRATIGRRLIWKEPVQATRHQEIDFPYLFKLLAMGFPKMKFVFLVRDPVPVINSMMKRSWGNSLMEGEERYLDLDTCISTWKESSLVYQDLPKERTHLLKFEKLIDQPEKESERLAAFLQIPLGSPFEPRPTKNIDLDQEIRTHIKSCLSKEMTVFGYS